MDLRIVFMGTPDFAVPALRILVENGYKIVGVITATDKYGGRGNKRLIESPVKKAAVELGIPVLQPPNLKDPTFIEALRNLNANLQIIVAFRMLPAAVWDMPELGTFNLHGSLLPKYRGAAPINWAIIRGEKETGVTSFFLQHEIDTGDMILQETLDISPNETAGDIHDRMMVLGANIVLKTVKKIQTNQVVTQKQDDTQATSAPKLFKDNCQIKFDLPGHDVHNFIRGLSPYPAAWSTWNGKNLKIIRTEWNESLATTNHAQPGQLRVIGKKRLEVATKDLWLPILELQLEGKKRMRVPDFLNGQKGVDESFLVLK